MKKDPLRILSHVILGVLILQYLFGMAANLFVQFPDTTNENAHWEFAKTQATIVIHIVLAFLLVIASIVLLIRAIRRKDKNWIIAGSVGLFAMVAAFLSGAEFITTQADGYSYAMAVTFILAFLSYGWGIYKSKK